ncbi:hypothetical protein HP393_21170 [Clostridioides difficile]|nr:hypothetical protein [Clostridioides difficile]
MDRRWEKVYLSRYLLMVSEVGMAEIGTEIGTETETAAAVAFMILI